jgi:hypothetical protein
MLGDEGLNDAFALRIFVRDAAKLVVVSLPLALRTHPFDAVQAFLEQVVGTRAEILPLPHPQPVTRRTIRPEVVAAQGRNLGLVGLSCDLVNQVRLVIFAVSSDSAGLDGLQLRFADAAADKASMRPMDNCARISLGLGRRFQRTTKDSSSMAISFSKISRSRAGSSVAGSKQPRIQALFKISGLRPFRCKHSVNP